MKVSRGMLVASVAVLHLASVADAAAQANASCTVSVSSIVFGAYNVFNPAATDSTGTITYSCNNQGNHISIGLSRGSSSTFAPRTLTKGSETLTYNLFLNAARTTIWGDGTSGTSMYTRVNPPNNVSVGVTIYGRIDAAQDVSAGSYSDTIAATINF